MAAGALMRPAAAGRCGDRAAGRKAGRAVGRWGALSAALILCGCAAMGVDPVVEIPLAEASLTPEARSRGVASSQIVTFIAVDETTGVMLDGARCEAASRDLNARFTAPARLALPLFEPDTAPLLVVCKHPQAGRAQISVAPEAPLRAANRSESADEFGDRLSGEIIAFFSAAGELFGERPGRAGDGAEGEGSPAAAPASMAAAARRVYQTEYRLSLSAARGRTAAAPPKPASVEARALAPVEGLAAPPASAEAGATADR